MPAPLDHDQLCAIARQVAAAAAAAVRENANPERYTGTINAGGDRVLVVDLAADAAAQQSLAAALEAAGQPYSVLSEESGVTDHGAPYPLFLLDPVDGSAQARRRHPDCSVSIAVALGPTMADIVAGVVQPIMCGDPYLAIRGHGAYLGDRPLPLTPIPSGRATSVLLEGSNAPAALAMAQRFATHDPTCQLHMSGSIALQLALLAAGCYDVLIAGRPGASAHDMAAGWLLVREAGAAYADLGGLATEAAPLTGIRHHPAAARHPDLLETAIAVARGAAPGE